MFKELFTESKEITFSNGEPNEKEVYLMVPGYGSVVITPSSDESSTIEDLEDFKVKVDSKVKRLIKKALKAIDKK